jgi:predicted CoA-binding protein
MTNRKTIDEFLAHKRLAVVGVSRNAHDFSRSVFREFEKQGYDVVPVNPGAAEVEGKRCFARVSEIDPPVKAALLFTPADRTEDAVDDCAFAHVDHIWMHRGARGPGAVNQRAVNFCNEHGISVVVGECPLMFLGNPGWPHRMHAFIRKLKHTYPAAARETGAAHGD